MTKNKSLAVSKNTWCCYITSRGFASFMWFYTTICPLFCLSTCIDSFGTRYCRCFFVVQIQHIIKDDSLLNKKWAPCQTQNVQFTKPWVFCSPLWDCRDKKHVTANNRRRPEKTTRHRFTWRQGEGCIPMIPGIAHGPGGDSPIYEQLSTSFKPNNWFVIFLCQQLVGSW